MVMELNQRIYKARTEAGLTQDDLAKAIGKTRGAVAQWESGDIRPRHNTLVDIAKATAVPIDWLESGVTNRTAGLLVAGEVAGGVWLEASLEFEPFGVPVAPHPAYPAFAQRLYRVRGNSVNKVVADGEFIHCVSVMDGGAQPMDGDLVVVTRTEHGRTEYTAKRLRFLKGQKILRPESTDPAWQTDLEINGNEDTEISVTDVVIAKWSPLRTVR